MPTNVRIRFGVLVVHGVLAFGLGLVFFYLRALMDSPLFETAAVTIAVLLAAAAFLLAAISDWFAAFSEGMKDVHRLVFYSLAGLTFAVAGVVVGYYPQNTMQWLLGLTAAHALVFGITAFASALRTQRPVAERWPMYLMGTISLVYSGTIAALLRDVEDTMAMGLAAAYLCFVGGKILYFAWDLRRKKLPDAQSGIVRADAVR